MTQKTVTPMQKVSSDMQYIRDFFKNLGYNHIELNKCSEKTTKYHEFMSFSNEEKTSVRGAVLSDHIELFSTEIALLKNKYPIVFQFGIAFNYTDATQTESITLSITENVFSLSKDNKKENKTVMASFYSKPLSISEFKAFIKDFSLFMNSEENASYNSSTKTDLFKEWFLVHYSQITFLEKEKKISRIFSKI